MLNITTLYILIALIALAIITIFVFLVKKDKKHTPLSTLASLAFAFVGASIVFGDNRLIGYSLMGIGVLLAIIDIIVVKSRKK